MVMKKSASADDLAMEEDAKKRRRGLAWMRGKSTGARRKDKEAAPDNATPKTSNSKGSLVPPEGLLSSVSSLAPSVASAPPATPLAPPPEPKQKKSLLTLNRATNWFCRTAYFKRTCDGVFDAIDSDYSGTVDETELYSGLLMIHLKLGMYAGQAACRPLSRDRCRAIFQKMDMDGSMTLDKREFRHVMAVLFGNVLTRVFVQWCLTLMIVPWIAQAILDGIWRTFSYTISTIQDLDEHSEVANQIELTVEDVGEWCLAHTPLSVLSTSTVLGRTLALVPKGVWKAVPLTVLSTILSLIAVPYVIYQVDDHFQRMADRKAEIKNKRRKLHPSEVGNPN